MYFIAFVKLIGPLKRICLYLYYIESAEIREEQLEDSTGAQSLIGNHIQI